MAKKATAIATIRIKASTKRRAERLAAAFGDWIVRESNHADETIDFNPNAGESWEIVVPARRR